MDWIEKQIAGATFCRRSDQVKKVKGGKMSLKNKAYFMVVLKIRVRLKVEILWICHYSISIFTVLFQYFVFHSLLPFSFSVSRPY